MRRRDGERRQEREEREREREKERERVTLAPRNRSFSKNNTKHSSASAVPTDFFIHPSYDEIRSHNPYPSYPALTLRNILYSTNLSWKQLIKSFMTNHIVFTPQARMLHLVITLMTRCNILRFGQNKQSANGGVGHTYGPHKIWAIRVCHTYRVAMGE